MQAHLHLQNIGKEHSVYNFYTQSTLNFINCLCWPYKSLSRRIPQSHQYNNHGEGKSNCVSNIWCTRYNWPTRLTLQSSVLEFLGGQAAKRVAGLIKFHPTCPKTFNIYIHTLALHMTRFLFFLFFCIRWQDFICCMCLSHAWLITIGCHGIRLSLSLSLSPSLSLNFLLDSSDTGPPQARSKLAIFEQKPLIMSTRPHSLISQTRAFNLGHYFLSLLHLHRSWHSSLTQISASRDEIIA